MNKKSLFLTLLLIGGLFTLEEARPVDLITAMNHVGMIQAVLFGGVVFATWPSQNHLAKYGIKQQSDIKEYKVFMKLTTQNNTLYEGNVQAQNPSELFSKIITIVDSFKNISQKKLVLSCSIVSKEDNKEHVIKTTTLKGRYLQKLLPRLEKIFLIRKEQSHRRSNYAKRGLFYTLSFMATAQCSLAIYYCFSLIFG